MSADLSLPAAAAAARTAAAPRHASLALMAASGFAGLGYQTVWVQQGALWLGHESAAVLAVITAFFGGLALGALALGGRIERSGRPARWYAACEAVIALWSLVLMGAMAPLSAALLGLVGAQPSPLWQWAVDFGGCFLLLLPATAAMGATLPAIERVMASQRATGRSIAAHYASNTGGALLGVLATSFWLVPSFGLTRTTAVCVALNLLCALAALAWPPAGVASGTARSNEGAAPSDAGPDAASTAAAAPPAAARATLRRLAATGLLGIGYEVLVVRVLSQVAEDTVYTYALLLAVYLAGSALGAAAYPRWRARQRDTARLGDRLSIALALACGAGTATLWAAEALRAQAAVALGGGLAAAIGAEALLASAAFGLPTLAMGALFSHLSTEAQAQGASFGRALGVNTLAAAAAPPLCGVLLAPWAGPKNALLLIALAYLLLASRAAWRSPQVWAPVGALSALALWAPPLAFVERPDGGRIVSYRDGAMAAVSVVEDADGVARLRINNRQQEGSSSSRLVDARQALLPLLLHPAPRRALFLGLGTGITAASAAEDPTLQVDAVELLPEVIDASAYFTRGIDTGPPEQPRLHLHAADARRYVRTSARRYDVVVSDNFHPARSGSGALYTVEHFRAVRERLAPGGLFCQWLPLHQLDLDTLRSIVRTFLVAYPDGQALLASHSLQTPVLGLVGRAEPRGLDPAGVRERLRSAALPQGLARFAIDDEFALLGSFVAGPPALARFAGPAPVNSDDRPVVAYRAPRITYAPDSRPRDRLLALLHELTIEPSELLAPPADADVARRLRAYWTARDRYLEAGRDVRPAASAQAMLAQVQAPLLAVLRSSPDFRPAYEPLLRMAGALAAQDPAAARALLTELDRLQPAWPQARQALQQLDRRTP